MKKYLFLVLIICSLFFTGCFSEKKSPFYNSEWLMENVDSENNKYYHQLFLKPKHQVTFQSYYENGNAAIVWTGTYKINAKKIVFDFTQCTRFENNEIVGNYTAGQIINYYSGEFLYSIGLVGEGEDKKYHLQLIRPSDNYFYSNANDMFGNPFEDFVKQE